MANSIKDLLTKIKSLPVTNQRCISALIGVTVADAATRPLHWIYDGRVMNRVVGDSKQPEFWPESHSPYYTIPLGLNSCYNDIAVAALWSLNENDGKLDIKHICESFRKHFGTGTEYAETLARRPVDRSKLPIEGPWLHLAMIRFLAKYEKGKTGILGDPDVVEFDGFCAALPVILKNAGKDDMWTEASKVTHLLNTHVELNEMFHAGALLVESFIMGEDDPLGKVKMSIESLYPNVVQIINEVEEAISRPYVSTVARFGKACYLPGSFQGALLAMLQTSSFVDAVRLNMIAGGCNCGRVSLLGACFGAKYGIDGIPIEWMEKVTNIEKVMTMAISVFGE